MSISLFLSLEMGLAAKILKRLKLVAGVVLAAIAVFFATVYAVFLLYDFNKLKPFITKAVRETTGRELTLGDIGVKIGLTPTITVGDVRLGNSPWGSRKDMLKVKRLEVGIYLLPLISWNHRGNVELKRVALIEPDIFIEKNALGKTNLEFETPGKFKAPAEKKEKSPLSRLKTIHIVNGLLAYKDGAGELYRVKLESVAVRMKAGATDVELKAGYKGVPLKIFGRVSNPLSGVLSVSDFKANSGESDLSGSLEAKSGGGGVPKIKAEFSSKKLDLRPFLSGKKTNGQAGPKTGKVFSNAPLPFDSLKKADAVVKWSAGKILFPGITLGKVDVVIALKDGRLALRPLTAQINGSTVKGGINIDASGPAASVSAAFKAQAMDIGRLLKDLEVTDAVEGRLDMDIDIRGRGDSIASIMAGLDGSAVLIMGKGRVYNKYLGIFGGDIFTGVMRMLNPSKDASGASEVNCFVCRLDAKGGIADTTVLTLDTALTGVEGKGRVDFKTEELSVAFKLSPKKAPGIGNLGLSLSELTRPLKLGGTLANPSLTIDTAQAAITIGKIAGGITLFGPAGVAAVFVGENGGGENLCPNALNKAKAGAAEK